ncbi:Maf-like protein [Clostridium gasigenes]|uniref:dTTP/UTP pyrophosphatase n=1 Tax=Clostridium gasigenes TaxID=94869 RepID=A0A1H0RZK0_9CLOT|nr:Maf-like protein [Clostridium gasigenes]MBB6622668.1 Maf-like protein [Clostridium gasigenes]MBB6714266.1 Maf-like protein [Clostridium gasigenes]MBU3088600.1 Maf-like protein [Clostridium gasigenes]MBU3132856.1 Maf-like protein [Clostridium gasigenes]MBU3136624.1 Maf-like protein [Clostridium gasigenes]
MKYILASASERRQELLHRIVNDFDIIISNFDEDSVRVGKNVEEYVIEIAEGKAIDVIKNINEDAVVIAADTIVTLDNKILGKPKDENHAFEMLKLLSGKTHRVYSAVVVINTKNKKVEKKCLYTEVKFSEITDEEIKQYIETREPLDKAGSYGIQGYGGIFVEKINGCYYNVVGLPLNSLNKMIKNVI